MWIAKRAMRFNGKLYRGGDPVPAEGTRNLRALKNTGWIAWVDAEVEEAASEAGDLHALKRAELNAVAADAGIADPETLPNKGAVIAAIEQTQTHADADVVEGDGTGEALTELPDDAIPVDAPANDDGEADDDEPDQGALDATPGDAVAEGGDDGDVHAGG